MDIEKMRKVNELTAELKKHKSILPDDDFLKQAKAHVLHEDPLSLGDEPEPRKEPSSAELLVQESNKAIKAELDLLRKGLLQLNEEFKAFRQETKDALQQVRQLALSTPPELPLPPKEEVTVEPVEQASASREPDPAPREGKETEVKKKEAVDRNGYAPSDVAVDKVFYFGKK